MVALLAVFRLLICLIFGVAGIAKLADLTATRNMLLEFGVPRRLLKLAAVLLPAAEIAVAASLLSVKTAWWAAVAALFLVLLFTSAIVVNLWNGKKPSCNCFGQIHSSPIGFLTLIRNGVLAALIVSVLWLGKDSGNLDIWPTLGKSSSVNLVIAFIGALLVIVIAAQAWLIVHLLLQHGRVLVRLDQLENSLTGNSARLEETQMSSGLEIGSVAPTFELESLTGEMLSLEQLRALPIPILLVFSHPHCGPCNALLPSLARWQKEHAAVLKIVVVSGGNLADNYKNAKEYGLEMILIQREHEVAASYMIVATPSAVVVSHEGLVSSPVASGAEAIGRVVKSLSKIGGAVDGVVSESWSNRGAKQIASGGEMPLTHARDRASR